MSVNHSVPVKPPNHLQQPCHCHCGGGGMYNEITRQCNRETQIWVQQTLRGGNLDQEWIKVEAKHFFGDHIEKCDKKTVH